VEFSTFTEAADVAIFDLRIIRSVAAIAMFMVAGKAAAQMERVQPKLGNADKSQLVTGDWYVVKVEQGKLSRQEQGALLKVTDEWLVLGVRKLTAEKTDVPWLGEMPYIGSLFRVVKQRDQLCVEWFPCATTTIESRTAFEKKEDLSPFGVDQRKLEDCSQLVVASDGKEEFFYTTSGIAIRDGALHFSARKPGASETTVQNVPLDDVLFAAQMIPVEKTTAKTANARPATMR
jgi:hypothetical protein